MNDGPANQFAGNISVHGCHAKGQGGGILIHNSSFSSHGYLDVQQCMALGDKGGGLLVESNVNLSGSASFVDCSVDNGHGGGIYSSGNITITGPATFKNCEAKYKGAMVASSCCGSPPNLFRRVALLFQTCWRRLDRAFIFCTRDCYGFFSTASRSRDEFCSGFVHARWRLHQFGVRGNAECHV